MDLVVLEKRRFQQFYKPVARYQWLANDFKKGRAQRLVGSMQTSLNVDKSENISHLVIFEIKGNRLRLLCGSQFTQIELTNLNLDDPRIVQDELKISSQICLQAYKSVRIVKKRSNRRVYIYF